VRAHVIDAELAERPIDATGMDGTRERVGHQRLS
jgi:hypothetical protein